jgi:O-methyltransferase domain
MDEMLPPILATNRYLRQHGCHSLLRTYTHTPHSWYNNMSGSNFWEVLNSSPARINRFMNGLSMWSVMHPVVTMFPFATALAPGNNENRTLAVDIGGGRGGAMLELRKMCPELKGSIILQDRPYILDEIADKDLLGVTKMPHDFFQPQPVHGAQMYYIRRVMHDWQDVDAARILRGIVPAMAKDSRIIVSDMALPEPVTARDATAVWLDIMMLAIGGKERTKRDWEILGEMAGLRLVKVWMEEERFGPLCVVEYMLPETGGDGVRDNGLVGEGIGGAAVDGDKVMGVGLGGDGAGDDRDGARTPVAEQVDATGADEEAMGMNAAIRREEAEGHGQEQEQEQEQREREKDVDWEERTVVGDREQSVEPGQGA